MSGVEFQIHPKEEFFNKTLCAEETNMSLAAIPPSERFGETGPTNKLIVHLVRFAQSDDG